MRPPPCLFSPQALRAIVGPALRLDELHHLTYFLVRNEGAVIRVKRAVRRHKKQITVTEQLFAAHGSRIVRESIREVTWKEIRAGKLALISP
jgi:hypothetical protein